MKISYVPRIAQGLKTVSLANQNQEIQVFGTSPRPHIVDFMTGACGPVEM